MKTKLRTFRIGHGISSVHQHNKRDGCFSGGLYKSPSPGQSVDASQPVTVSWDTSCLNMSAIDIYLYAPNATIPILHEWRNVDYKIEGYNATLQAGWWNFTSPMGLEFTIVPAGQPPYLATLPAGPLFQATYSGPHDTLTVAGAVEQVNNIPSEKHATSKGAIAAAVVLPLLFIALMAAVYIKVSRQKSNNKRKRFSEMVDKRMSTISTDWKSLSGAGANAAVRNSIAVSGNRSSSFSFGGIRPMSTVAFESGQAGIGARGVIQNAADGPAPPVSHLRPGLRTSAFENRVSRVSFAADTRPSRSFYNASVPPVPERQNSAETSSNTSPIMSPVQTAGPLTLTPDDIRARMSGQDAAPRPSIDEVMPALTMMRTGAREGAADDLLLKTRMPTPPSPTHQVPKSPIMGVMPMQPMPANVMSPDDMLRAYAERRATGVGPAGIPSVPSPAANYNGTGMRTLYSPEAQQFPEPTYQSSQINRKSLAPTEYSKYDDEDAYVGTAE